MLTSNLLRDRNIALHLAIGEARAEERAWRPMPDSLEAQGCYLPDDPVPLILLARRPIVAEGWLEATFDPATALALWRHAAGPLSFGDVNGNHPNAAEARGNLARLVDHLDRALRAAGPGTKAAARWALDHHARRAHVNHLIVTSPAMPAAIVRRANRQAVAVMRVVDEVLGTSYAVHDTRRRRQLHEARLVHCRLADGRTLAEAREAERRRPGTGGRHPAVPPAR